MTKKTIEKTITINATAANVWRVFTDPVVTKQMGGRYKTDWKVGSAFGWEGNDGELYSHGKILQIQKNKLLQHNISDPESRGMILSIITYRLTEQDGKTLLHGKEEMMDALDPEEYAEAVTGWDEALQAVKEIAEGAKK